MRRLWPLALMDVRGSGPNQTRELVAPTVPRVFPIQSIFTSSKDLLDQRDDATHTLGNDNAELGEVGTQGVGQHRPLADQQSASPMQHQHGLLIGTVPVGN
jgi:hypothetical protein